ncbi:hypothetical protein QG37_06100 [Candidozyma auris]|uniref:Uncharacterized protein n=1 Tax=Candidozyma auris TaxID=498019 RepID=A0A0L0NU44_CANAR|nr:hypothetical protein QG37_06100 [[Candida] auris]
MADGSDAPDTKARCEARDRFIFELLYDEDAILFMQL